MHDPAHPLQALVAQTGQTVQEALTSLAQLTQPAHDMAATLAARHREAARLRAPAPLYPPLRQPRPASASPLCGPPACQLLPMPGLTHARGLPRRRLPPRIQTRSPPVLAVKRDDSVKEPIGMARLIDDALAADRRETAPPAVDELQADKDDEPGPEPGGQ